ncbi:polysaccharide biosynthesis C-terminal domain-containing protein [candidate division WOR-3 bacterium]|nr:polysaccharide biosynthesis C-terminal domain-containing protein [candidate division WOR-3 bacterium]
MIKALFKDMAKYIPAQIVPGIVGFISIPIITRLFLPDDYGNYVLVIATISVLSTIVGWLSMSIIRFYSACKRDGQLLELYNAIVRCLFISICTLSLVFFSFSIVFNIRNQLGNQLYHLMLIGIPFFILTSAFGVLLSFLWAKRQANWYSGFSIWKSIAALIIGITLITKFHFGVEGLLWGSILSIGIALPLLLKITRIKISIRNNTNTAKLTKEMAKYSFPLVAGNLAAWILSLSDRYILELYRGAHEVGIYSASYNISAHSIMLLASLFMLASSPIMINIWENKGEGKSKEFVNKLTRYYLIICIPAVVGLSALAKPVIDILTGEEYLMGYQVIPFVTLGALFLGLQQRFQAGFLFYKKTGFIAFSIVTSGLLNLGLNFLLIPKYGYMAAALTTLVSYAFLLFLMIITSRRFFVWEFPFKTLVKVSLASAIMGGIVYPIGNNLTSSVPINLILGIFVGVVVYIVMLIVLQEPNKQEIQTLQTMRAKVSVKSRSKKYH